MISRIPPIAPPAAMMAENDKKMQDNTVKCDFAYSLRGIISGESVQKVKKCKFKILLFLVSKHHVLTFHTKKSEKSTR